ncbi:hypothetical protein Tco_1157682, partial [Tanacetum coccineum]
MPVEKSSASKKPERQIPIGHRFSNKKTATVPEKTINPKSCLRWKPTGRIFSNVRLSWIPIGKLLNSCTGKVESTSFNGQKQQRTNFNADALSNEKQENLRVCRSSLGRQCQKTSVHISSGLVLYQKTFDRSRLSLGLHVKFKAGSKSCSSSSQDSYIMTRVGITIPPLHSNAEDN